MRSLILTLLVALSAVRPAVAQSQAALALKPGDHVALIGNALPDRMQHTGYLETLLQTKFPKHQLVFRNLAASGDEVVLRHRSDNFGSPDEWLGRVGADVILAFFGYNESFKGEAGLPKFRDDLDQWLKTTKSRNYSGKGSPRIVLFSPIAMEKHRDSNFADPAAANANIALYSAAMSEVAKANGVPFIDILKPSQQLYAAAAARGASVTINGFLLSEAGDKALAPSMYQGLVGEAAPATGPESPSSAFEKLRSAVNDKNALWHSRYRTIDGYNVYGGRSAVAYLPGKGGSINDRNAPAPYTSNYKIMQQEMAVRDVMTANRDQRVWAIAGGGDLVVKDDNLPTVDKVPTNKPGPKEDGSHVFLSGEEGISRMKVHSGMKVNLFADEKQFPELINPVQMAWDTKGRLWVAAWRNYPERTPWSKEGDSLLVFEDTNGDGKADKMTKFLTDLNAPTGLQFHKDGVLVMQAPDFWFVRDTDGDGKADFRERMLMGLDSADSHHTANAICHDPGGALYLSDGVFHRTQVETATGPVRNNDGAIYRYEPLTAKFETYVSYGFANPHGRVFDRWGNDIITDATGNASYFGAAFSGRIDYPAKHPSMKQFWERPSRPCPGTGILTSRHFPEEFQGNFLNLNVIGFQGMFRVKVSEDGSGIAGQTLENIVSSTDPNFRPIAVSVGPDGALYFADWHNTIIGHLQHHLRDPNRAVGLGRIYRITYEGRPLLTPKKIDGQPVESLLELLKEPEDGVRELAKIELSKHEAAKVVAATKKWAASLDKSDKEYEHHMMEALWVHQWHNVVDADFLKRMLASPDHRARAAAARVLCYWRDRVPGALGLFAKVATDAHPRVRLEAVRAASFYNVPEAADVALAALKHPTDYYLDYTMKETLRQLEPVWRKAIASGRPIAADNPAGLGFLIGSLTTPELLKLPKTEPVQVALLKRADVTINDRLEALDGLAKTRKTTRLAELFAVIDSAETTALASLGGILPTQPPAELKASRDRVAKLATDPRSPALRRLGWAGLVTADAGFDQVWTVASKSPSSLTDLLAGIPLIVDPTLRGKAYERVSPLLAGLPADLAATAKSASAGKGRYVRIELPRRGTLTLAEVEVISDGRNVARRGKARQSSTASGGAAAPANDGRTDGTYAANTQTHTAEDQQNPWWEVDLGAEFQIETVAVWNRRDGGLGRRLDGFTLSVLDGGRSEVFRKAGVPAPDTSVALAVSADAAGDLQRAAIRASVSMGREPAAVFTALGSLIGKGEQIVASAQGIRALPRDTWPKPAAGAVAKSLLGWAKTIPAGERTSQDYVETVQVASDLAGLLPADQAGALRKELKEYRVDVFVLRTVREQMRYDSPRIVVEAGKAFEIILENDDFMPHNLAVVKPGTREAVGKAAEAMTPDKLDSSGRAYMPASLDIIAATKLIEAGQRTTFRLTAPTTTGDYDYVCTFPGHATMMWGRLVVTKDVDAYLLANPVANLPKPDPAHQHKAGF